MPVWVTVGAVNAFLAVAAGAFGAHALKTRLAPDLLAVFETGARYHLFHAIALVALGALVATRPQPAFHWAGIAFTCGIALFSGSLYALALSGVRVLGAITPLGGLGFLAGWALVAWGAWRAG